MITDLYIYKKEVDWSALNIGINIPISLQSVFYENIELVMKKGDSKKIKLLLDGIEYPVTLNNIYFDVNKYPMHKELLQIRYTPNSLFAKKLREIFSESYSYLLSEKEKLTNKKKQLTVPKEFREYIAIYSTSFTDVFSLDCITNYEIADAKEAIKGLSESEIVQIINSQDYDSSLYEKRKIVKIRKLDKTIGENLKRVYQYRCQICGLYIGEAYNANVIHTHHIEPFSLSLNNNPDNIMIICPNHHGIIHATNPFFDKMLKVYKYPNGYVESLKLNLHL